MLQLIERWRIILRIKMTYVIPNIFSSRKRGDGVYGGSKEVHKSSEAKHFECRKIPFSSLGKLKRPIHISTRFFPEKIESHKPMI